MRANTARCVECVLYFGPYKTLQKTNTLSEALDTSKALHCTCQHLKTNLSLSLDSTLSLSPAPQASSAYSHAARPCPLALAACALPTRRYSSHTLKNAPQYPGRSAHTHTSKLFTHKKKNKPAVHSSQTILIRMCRHSAAARPPASTARLLAS